MFEKINQPDHEKKRETPWNAIVIALTSLILIYATMSHVAQMRASEQDGVVIGINYKSLGEQVLVEPILADGLLIMSGDDGNILFGDSVTAVTVPVELFAHADYTYVDSSGKVFPCSVADPSTERLALLCN